MSLYLGSSKIASTYIINEYQWSRPGDWPNLDKLNISPDNEEVYFTYDNRDRTNPAYFCINLTMSPSGSSNKYQVRVGTVDNGVFTPLDSAATESYSSQNLTIRYDTYNIDYVVFKLTNSSTSHITRFSFGIVSTAVSGLSSNLAGREQKCIERRGYLPYIVGTSSTYSCSYLECDNLVPGSKAVVTTLDNAWANANALKEINFSNWNTKNWAVAALTNAFSSCYNLHYLNLNYWDVSNWPVTTLAGMFSGCSNLKKVDWDKWDTSKFVISNMSNCFHSCYSLQHIDYSCFQNASWNLTSTGFNYINYSNYCLESLDLSAMGYSNAITITSNQPSPGYYLYRIKDLKLWNNQCTFPIYLSHTHNMRAQNYINLFNQLATTATSYTITIGAQGKGVLTPEQIAIATQKGYTVA